MMACLDGQLYFWGGAPEYRIWIGGNPGNRFSVSTGTGGGFVDCEPGVGTVVTNVLKFKTQQGASIVTALCDSANSQREHRFNLVETNISLSNEQSAKAWQAEKVAGTVGCNADRVGQCCALTHYDAVACITRLRRRQRNQNGTVARENLAEIGISVDDVPSCWEPFVVLATAVPVNPPAVLVGEKVPVKS